MFLGKHLKLKTKKIPGNNGDLSFLFKSPKTRQSYRGTIVITK